MTSMRSLVDAALAEAYGYAQTIDTTTYLSSPIDASALTIQVSNADRFSRGLVQVDDELMIVDEVDRTNNLMKVGYLSGRGVRSTVAAPHAIGALVTMAPSIPRHQAVEAVAESIKGASGLFAVGTVATPCVGSQSSYSVPATTTHVLDVRWKPPGVSDEWIACRRWDYDKFTQQVVIHDGITPGRDILITCARDPEVPLQDEDFSETGLPDSCADVIRLGAIWRIVSFLEPYNLLAKSAEMEAMDRQKTPGSRLRVSQYYFGLYQQRLQQEVAELQNRYPTRISFGIW